jgi:hypothetical protein
LCLLILLTLLLLLVPPPRCNIPGNANEEGDGNDDALYGGIERIEPEPGPALLSAFVNHEPTPPHVVEIVFNMFDVFDVL